MTEHYIHGFSGAEQARLIRQADILAPVVFRGLDYGASKNLLEIGCAVGAELKIIGRRWPHLHVTGLDRSAAHLDTAADYLKEEINHNRIRLVQGDARALPFADDVFDHVLAVWMLEHVQEVKQVITEALRVVRPNGTLILTEVDNDTFGFEPYNGDQQSIRVQGPPQEYTKGQGRYGVVTHGQGRCQPISRYAQVSLKANERYLDALSLVDDPAVAYELLKGNGPKEEPVDGRPGYAKPAG